MDIREMSAEEHQAIKTVFTIAKPEIKNGSSIITLKDGSRIFYSADRRIYRPQRFNGRAERATDPRVRRWIESKAEHQRAHAPPVGH